MPSCIFALRSIQSYRFLCHVIKPHSLIFSLQFGSRVDYTKLFVVVVVIVVALVVK